jgi:hypothetical protein
MSNKTTRILAAVALAGAAGSAVSLAAAGPAAAAPWAPKGPQPVNTRLAPVKANTTSFVNIAWRSNTPACDVRLRVEGGRNVVVSYLRPGRFTTFSTGNTLRPGRTAVTTVRVSPMRRDSGFEVLRAALSYTDCSRHGRTQITRTNLVLPVVRNMGPVQQPGHSMPGQQPGHSMPGQQGHQDQQGQQGQQGQHGHGPQL